MFIFFFVLRKLSLILNKNNTTCLNLLKRMQTRRNSSKCTHFFLISAGKKAANFLTFENNKTLSNYIL